MKIRVDRDSICMGDDAFSHQIDLDIPEDTTVEGLCSFLQKDRYLPNLDWAAWQLLYGGKTVVSYHTETEELTNPNIYLKDLIYQGSGDSYFVWIHYCIDQKRE